MTPRVFFKPYDAFQIPDGSLGVEHGHDGVERLVRTPTLVAA